MFVSSLVTYTAPSDVILLVQDGLTSLNETNDLEISCSSYGYPPPSIHWQRNSQAIVEGNNRITISSSIPSENLLETPVNSTLRIANLLPSDEGEYVCVASNVEETKSNSTNITVNGKWHLIVVSNCMNPSYMRSK